MNPREKPFGMVTRWKGVFTLEVLESKGYGHFRVIARHRAEALDQILEHADRHGLIKVSVMVKESKKGGRSATKNRR